MLSTSAHQPKLNPQEVYYLKEEGRNAAPPNSFPLSRFKTYIQSRGLIEENLI
jgi:hypothetical protein